MLRSFRELVVWQKSMQLAGTVYRLTQGFPREEIYGLASQLRRCAVSLPSNIAEGSGRLSAREYRQFLAIARGSNFELQTQLELARSFGMEDMEMIDDAEGLSHEIGRMLHSMLEKLKPATPTRNR